MTINLGTRLVENFQKNPPKMIEMYSGITKNIIDASVSLIDYFTRAREETGIPKSLPLTALHLAVSMRLNRTIRYLKHWVKESDRANVVKFALSIGRKDMVPIILKEDFPTKVRATSN